MTAKDEARKIVQALFDELGMGGYCPKGCPYIDGYDAIEEMEEKSWPSWKQVEWPGFYLKHKIRELVSHRYPDEFIDWGEGALYLLKGDYIWDSRFNAIGDRQNEIPFLSVDNINQIIEEAGGLGLIVVNAVVNRDLDGKFREHLERKKHGPSDYDIERELDGRPPKTRKTAFMITRVYSFYFPEEEIHRGPNEGWINPTFQEDRRQSDGGTREGKYLIYLDRIPLYYQLDVVNFNEDSEDWATEFG